MSTATRNVLPADGTLERLDVLFAIVPEEIMESEGDWRLSETTVRRPVESRTPKRSAAGEEIPFDKLFFQFLDSSLHSYTFNLMGIIASQCKCLKKMFIDVGL